MRMLWKQLIVKLELLLSFRRDWTIFFQYFFRSQFFQFDFGKNWKNWKNFFQFGSRSPKEQVRSVTIHPTLSEHYFFTDVRWFDHGSGYNADIIKKFKLARLPTRSSAGLVRYSPAPSQGRLRRRLKHNAAREWPAPVRRIDRRRCAVSRGQTLKRACQSKWCKWHWEPTVRMQSESAQERNALNSEMPGCRFVWFLSICQTSAFKYLFLLNFLWGWCEQAEYLFCCRKDDFFNVKEPILTWCLHNSKLVHYFC